MPGMTGKHQDIEPQITFHRATDTRSGNEFSIGMINGKTGAKLEPGAKN